MRSAASVTILLFAVMIVASARLMRSVCLFGRSWSSLRPQSLSSSSILRDRSVIEVDRGEHRDCLLYRREYVNAIFRF